MNTKRRGLGKGLDALLGGVDNLEDLTREQPGDQVNTLPIDRIQRGRYQPRRHFPAESLQELADSIRAQGVVQPIVVRPLADGGKYELVAGERRWRAAQLAGLQDIPAVTRDMDDQTTAAVALIENIQREELNALEEAQALHRLVAEFAMTHQEAADMVGRSRAAVSNLLRLLELSEECKLLVDEGQLEMGHARALLALPLNQQLTAAKRIVALSLSVRAAEALVKKLLAGENKVREKPVTDPNVQALEQRLSETLGARVGIHQGDKGKGRVEIHYNSLDELDGILDHIK